MVIKQMLYVKKALKGKIPHMFETSKYQKCPIKAPKTYLIFVTGNTGGACVKKLPGVIFYRFNVKNWQFTV